MGEGPPARTFKRETVMGRDDITMAIEAEERDDVTVVTVKGRMTIGREAEMLDVLRDLVDGGRRKFVIDLHELDHIVSAGIGTLIGFNEHLKEAGGKAFLAGVHPRVRRIFKVMCLDSFIPIYPGVDDALKAFQAPS